MEWGKFDFDSQLSFGVLEQADRVSVVVDDGGIAVVLQLVPVCADDVEACNIALILYGSGGEQAVPMVGSFFGPVGNHEEQVIRIFRVIPRPFREPQIVADEGSDCPVAPVNGTGY